MGMRVGSVEAQGAVKFARGTSHIHKTSAWIEKDSVVERSPRRRIDMIMPFQETMKSRVM